MPLQALQNLVLAPAWTPFLEPMDVAAWWWWLVVPLVIGIAVVYKAIRLPSLRNYPWHVLRMTVQVMVVMFIMCAALYVIVLQVAPRIF